MHLPIHNTAWSKNKYTHATTQAVRLVENIRLITHEWYCSLYKLQKCLLLTKQEKNHSGYWLELKINPSTILLRYIPASKFLDSLRDNFHNRISQYPLLIFVVEHLEYKTYKVQNGKSCKMITSTDSSCYGLDQM
jgi:hypothetical protein